MEDKVTIEAKGIYYRELNQRVREAAAAGAGRIELRGVNGQRYIGDGLRGNFTITVDGVPGNDLAAFMDGPTIIVHSNAQDCVCNTMNSGKVIIHGHAGDVLGYGMRGGKLHIAGDVGYRVGIHMKAYQNKVPVIIAGGSAGDFFGEYMAGGIMILLGMNTYRDTIVGSYLGTGMHGGAIYIRGKVGSTIQAHQLGAEVGVRDIEEKDRKLLLELLAEYCQDLDFNLEEVLSEDFQKLVPISHRPYGKLYAY